MKIAGKWKTKQESGNKDEEEIIKKIEKLQK